MSRRVRRDSETSTDSWSLVEEEDRLDDDFSLSTDNDEGAELEQNEPIVEEPPTSDEEDTASENSLNSDSEDSELSENSESEDSESDDDGDDEIQEAEEAQEDVIGSESTDEDSDLSDAESEDSEVSDEDEEEDEDVELDDVASEVSEMNDEELAEAAMQLKEDEKWMDEELAESQADDARRSCRVLLAFSLFLMLFPLADVFTSWMLTYQNHRYVSPIQQKSEFKRFIFEDYDSQQSYYSKQDDRVVNVWKPVAEEQVEEDQYDKKFIKPNPEHLYLLKDLLLQRKVFTPKEPIRAHEILELFTNQSHEWKRQSDIPKPFKTHRKPTRVYPTFSKKHWSPKVSNVSFSATCRALAPVPPAPFSPRRVQKRQMPRHQPCFVHVNQSKWTCQKNLPSVIYSQNTTPNFTVMPRSLIKKRMGKTSEYKIQKAVKYDICAKKASESMRTMPKPTDQCHSRHFQKFTPRRKHIAYKAPLPCKVPTYKPTISKQSPRPSSSADDWHQKRSQYRAQLRSRA